MRPRILLVGILAVITAWGWGASDADAIPAWARKYKTSCATCHAAFPKLNAFGRAFQMNGYQFPGGVEEDEEKAQEKPVKMGSEAYKRVWPDAIWPNSIPGTIPLAVIVESEIPYLPNAAEGDPKVSFEDVPEAIAVAAGGNFTDNISFFAELEFVGGEAELEMAHISFDNILSDNALSLRIGKIVPYITPYSNMRRLSAPYWYATRSLGDNAWNLDRAQRGFEARGLLSEARLVYSIGLVEGRANLPNGDKDFYLHAGYKIGGMRLDGQREASAGPSQPWQDNSVRFDGFLYSGRATLAPGTKDTFTQVGASVDAFLNRFNVSALVVLQSDDRPLVGADVDGNGRHFMVEGTYVLYPWLLPNLRYEQFRAEIGDETETDHRFVPSLTALIRANVKALIAAEIEKEQGGDFEVGEIMFGLVFGL